MNKSFVEIKLFQVNPDKLEQFETIVEEMTKIQNECAGCISIKHFKRFYTIAGIGRGTKRTNKSS